MSIEVENISKRFGNFVALDNVSLSFPSGELVALLGPSGCGKTTLLRIIAGLEGQDSGRVLLNGQDMSGKHVRERRVGFVFQHYALFRHLTVFENVAFGLRVKPRAGRASEAQIGAKVRDLLKLVQLDWLADRYPPQLSGGQRQRIALARALAIEPRVLLLDEPFGALDAKVRKELRRWLRRLHDELHISSIFVTHDQEEAIEVADRLVLVNRGRVEQVGTPREVHEAPATSFVYSFLGASNEFKGRVEGDFVRVGATRLPHSDRRASDGEEVIGFARPHELQIVPHSDALGGIAAKVNRIFSFGRVARVELVGLDAINGSGLPQFYEVELAHEEVSRSGLEEGQRVQLVPPDLRVLDRPKAGRAA